MGAGGYSYERHDRSTKTRAKAGRQETFKSKETPSDMSPHGLKFREARDSEEHPNSKGVLIGMDVTGSMGDIPATLAQKTLPELMKVIHPILPDVQLCFGAIGDAYSDRSPLQIGQFESSDELFDQWLTKVHLEGRGGGWGQESYELAFLLAARHVAMDCLEKRGEKGYFFITGDEESYPQVSRRQVQEIFGYDLGADIPLEDIVAEVATKFHPFFLVPDEGRFNHGGVGNFWKKLLGDHVITMVTPDDTAHVMAAIIAATEGVVRTTEELGDFLNQHDCSGRQRDQVIRAVEPYAATIFAADHAPVQPVDDLKQSGRSRKVHL